jgi:hypothetical protein
LTQNHLDEVNAMAGRPMTDVFNAEDARIALRYVDEFVAQDDRYPVTNEPLTDHHQLFEFRDWVRIL